jgi:hypothetical protein
MGISTLRLNLISTLLIALRLNASLIMPTIGYDNHLAWTTSTFNCLAHHVPLSYYFDEQHLTTSFQSIRTNALSSSNNEWSGTRLVTNPCLRQWQTDVDSKTGIFPVDSEIYITTPTFDRKTLSLPSVTESVAMAALAKEQPRTRHKQSSSAKRAASKSTKKRLRHVQLAALPAFGMFKTSPLFQLRQQLAAAIRPAPRLMDVVNHLILALQQRFSTKGDPLFDSFYLRIEKDWSDMTSSIGLDNSFYDLEVSICVCAIIADPAFMTLFLCVHCLDVSESIIIDSATNR